MRPSLPLGLLLLLTGLLAGLATDVALADEVAGSEDAAGHSEAGQQPPSKLKDVPRPDEGAIPAEILQLARESRNLPLGERMRAVSEPLMGLPYQVDAAGEGVEPDTDPPARYDAFDCLTFVEEVLALTLPPDPTSAPAVRNALRYRDGEPSYEARNHFMLEEWVPNNLAKGLISDITAEVGDAHLLEKDVTDTTWRYWKRRRLFALDDARLPTGTFRLQVLSLAAAAEAMDRIPDGALLLTVRKSRDGVPIVVTHLGFMLPSTPEVPLMRHATKMGEEPRVRDDRLRWYLEHLRWYANWPVEGITVLMPQELGPRRVTVPPSSEVSP